MWVKGLPSRRSYSSNSVKKFRSASITSKMPRASITLSEWVYLSFLCFLLCFFLAITLVLLYIFNDTTCIHVKQDGIVHKVTWVHLCIITCIHILLFYVIIEWEVVALTKHYEQRKKANETYLAKMDDIKIRVPKGKREEYRKLADSCGKSLNGLVVELLEEFKSKNEL